MASLTPAITRSPDQTFLLLPRRAIWGLVPLPARAQQIVDAGLRRAEWRITLVQALIVVFLGVLFFLAPRPQGPVSDLRPVPYALAAMAVALSLRVGVLSLVPRLTRLWVYFSAVMDIAVIILLIWSFHMQYGDALALYLKAPTQLYLFVVIAWHGLAMDPLRVIFAGLVASAGWGLLTLASIQDGGSAILTHDFMTYMTSSRVLIGAEVDRVIAILLFTAVLSVGIASAREQMLMAALGTTATNELSRFFAAGLAGKIAASENRAEAGRAVKVDATVMMIDIRHFTRLASLSTPEQSLEMLTGLQSRAVAAVNRNGGDIDKFLGDGILATFGCVRPLEARASSAIRAAQELSADVAAWNRERRANGEHEVDIGIAISSGEVLFGTVGFGDRLEFTVIGETVNLAAKLEKYNKTLNSSMIMDDATYLRAEAEGYSPAILRRFPNSSIPGVSKPIGIVELA